MGFSIKNFMDYKRIYDLVNNYEEMKAAIEAEYSGAIGKVKNAFGAKDKRIAKLEEDFNKLKDKKDVIVLYPYKSYKVHELADMFPNNISPIYVHAKVTNEVLRKLRKSSENMKMLLTAAVACLIIIIGFVILMKSGVFQQGSGLAEAGGSLSNVISGAGQNLQVQ